MRGKIIKGIAGFYYIHVVQHGVYECKAKGIFRNKKIKPLVGDDVEIDVLDEPMKKGNVISIFPRKNELIRPAVANVDSALVVFALAMPEPNLNLLDRFLVMMELQDVKTTICFNKMDLVDEKRLLYFKQLYTDAGYDVIITSTVKDSGIDDIQHVFEHKTTVLAGPSGVGKSSILNKLVLDANMEIGSLSSKIGRGKHTTRHSEIFHLKEDSYIVDTPGFSSMFINDFEANEIRFYFPEFSAYEGRCRFNGCVHIKEPECVVKEAVDKKLISRERYDNYVSFYEELLNRKKY